MMTISQAIQAIVHEIPQAHVFDSHFIINRLIQDYSDIYLIFASSISASTNKTEVVHGQIAQEIAKLESSGAISRLEYKSWSHNIRLNASKCTAWIKG